MKLKHLRYFFTLMPPYATVATMSGSFYDTYILMLDSKLVEKSSGTPIF